MLTPCLKTGQITCFDEDGLIISCSESGHDGDLQKGVAWPMPRFEVSETIVTDRLSGLIWSRNANLAEYPLTWDEALAFVAQMNREQAFGYADWRLPNRVELRSLISHQTRKPALPEDHPFQDVIHSWYWSSTPAAISPAHAWYVNMEGGRMFYGEKTQFFLTWPVRGAGNGSLRATGATLCSDVAGKSIPCARSGQDAESRTGVHWPTPRFEVFKDTAIDRLTGLEWHNEAVLEGKEMCWEEALSAVARLNITRKKHNPWRLPNINELESLVDCARHSPALPLGHPFKAGDDVYWSSTTSMFVPDWAWALYVKKGAIGVGIKTVAFCAMAVRDADIKDAV